MREAIRRDCGIELQSASRFQKVSIRNVEYHSHSCRNITTRNSYTICYSTGGVDRFALVEYFLSLSDRTVAVIQQLTPNARYCYSEHLADLRRSIIPVTLDPVLHVVPVQSFLCKCVYVSLNTSMYVARPPNYLIEM